MRRWLVLGLVGCGGGGGTEAGDPLEVSGLAVAVSVVDQVVVTGTITLRDPAGAGGTDALTVFYSDDYATEIARANATVGASLEEAGDAEAFELTTIAARVLPHEDGYERVCAEVFVERTAVAGGTRVGCVDGEPETTSTTTYVPPEEPPTVEVFEPFDLQLYGIGETVDLDGRCRDANQSDGSLVARWTWEPLVGGAATEVSAEPITWDGYTRGSWASPPLGDYVIRLACTDDAAQTTSDARQISVVDRQLTDLDGDGFTPYEGDCNDNDAAVNPDAYEIPGNAVDEDCDTVLG